MVGVGKGLKPLNLARHLPPTARHESPTRRPAGQQNLVRTNGGVGGGIAI
jgi:hypothetical protein